MSLYTTPRDDQIISSKHLLYHVPLGSEAVLTQTRSQTELQPSHSNLCEMLLLENNKATSNLSSLNQRIELFTFRRRKIHFYSNNVQRTSNDITKHSVRLSSDFPTHGSTTNVLYKQQGMFLTTLQSASTFRHSSAVN